MDVVRAVAPFFDDFILEPDELDRRVLQLEWRHRSDPSYFDASSLSDGTLRFMCLATLLLQPTKPSVIVIDEPELGLHPAAIVQLAALLRLASHDCQVIVATQSVTLLDQFASEDVIVVERSNGESTFERLAQDQVRRPCREGDRRPVRRSKAPSLSHASRVRGNAVHEHQEVGASLR